MNQYTFKNGDFIITIHQPNIVQARKKLDECLNIIVRQIGFDNVPRAYDFELMNMKESVE
jgi:hypothetical protein